jgi:uncharacterized protein
MHKIEVKESTHGKGVFATSTIKKNEVIEIAPIIKLSKADTKFIDKTFLYNYYYEWKNQGSAIALGYGSVYNHSYQPNACYDLDYAHDRIVFKALRTIKPGEEIRNNYNGNPKKQTKVWFDK